MYVLVVYIAVSLASNSGISIANAEYTNKPACEQAAISAKDALKDIAISAIKIICIKEKDMK